MGTGNVQAHFYHTELLFLSTKLVFIRLIREHRPAHSHLQNLNPDSESPHRLPHQLVHKGKLTPERTVSWFSLGLRYFSSYHTDVWVVAK